MCAKKFLSYMKYEYLGQIWFAEVQEYIQLRYDSIEERYIKTFNYVAPEKENRYTYSYEYASILRDVGSAFDSTIKMIIKNAKLKYSNNIYGILKFLREREPDLEYVGLQFRNTNENLYPFKSGPDDNRPLWWLAYNKVKHSEVEHKTQGNFENTTNAMAALLFIRNIITDFSRSTNLFTIFNEPSVHGGKEYRNEFFK